MWKKYNFFDPTYMYTKVKLTHAQKSVDIEK